MFLSHFERIKCFEFYAIFINCIMNLYDQTQAIKNLAINLGFHKVGIASPEKPKHADYLIEWLKEGRHGTMHWMEKYLDKRLNVRKLYPDVRSIVVVALNYYTPHQHSSARGIGKISRYAWGRDYHKIMKKKLKQLLRQIKEEIDHAIDGRLFVDSAPVQEKLLAQHAGIGWQGKNTNIITRDMGSWIFLGELLLNYELVPDQPAQDYCGNCTACIEACPTDALKPYQLDAQKCISYLTIEHWNQPIPEPFVPKMEQWIFGCDICQDVCPWNRFAKVSDEVQFQPLSSELVAPDLHHMVKMQKEEFKRLFKHTPIIRAKYENFIRNIRTVLSLEDERT